MVAFYAPPPPFCGDNPKILTARLPRSQPRPRPQALCPLRLGRSARQALSASWGAGRACRRPPLPCMLGLAHAGLGRKAACSLPQAFFRQAGRQSRPPLEGSGRIKRLFRPAPPCPARGLHNGLEQGLAGRTGARPSRKGAGRRLQPEPSPARRERRAGSNLYPTGRACWARGPAPPTGSGS